MSSAAVADLKATGIRLRLDNTAEQIDAGAHEVRVRDGKGHRSVVAYDRLVIGTQALPIRPPIDGLEHLGAADGVHVVHYFGPRPWRRLLRHLASDGDNTSRKTSIARPSNVHDLAGRSQHY